MGGSICFAFFAIFMPLSWMHQTHEWLGLGAPPTERIFEYLARSTSAMYLAHGIIVLYASTNVRRNYSLISVLAWLNVFLGCSLLITDLWAGMPVAWTLLEGPMIVVGALFVHWLLSQTKPLADEQTSTESEA